MSIEVRPIKPNVGWPIRHLNANAAGIAHLADSPGEGLSHYITGLILGGGADADGLYILRRNCLRFVGTGDYMTVSDDAVLEPTTNDFALEVWVKIPSTITTIPKIVHKDDGADDGYVLELASGLAKFTIGDGTHTASATSARNIINDNRWYHIMVVIDESATAGLKIYVDGGLSGTTGDDMSAVVSCTGGATDLTVYGVATYDWYMSALGLYKGTGAAMTAAQVLARYARGVGHKFEGTETALSAAWNLDEGIGTTCYDVLSTQDGALTGTPVWCPHKASGATAKDETCGAPFDGDNSLDAIGKFTCGELTTSGVHGTTAITFAHAIKIGRNNPLRILETNGAWDLILFGTTDGV